MTPALTMECGERVEEVLGEEQATILREKPPVDLEQISKREANPVTN